MLNRKPEGATPAPTSVLPHSYWLRALPVLIALSIIVSAVYVLHRELSALRLADITLQIKAIPSAQLLWSLLFCAASYLVLINYDRLA